MIEYLMLSNVQKSVGLIPQLLLCISGWPFSIDSTVLLFDYFRNNHLVFMLLIERTLPNRADNKNVIFTLPEVL